jgi:hypothetical protein
MSVNIRICMFFQVRDLRTISEFSLFLPYTEESLTKPIYTHYSTRFNRLNFGSQYSPLTLSLIYKSQNYLFLPDLMAAFDWIKRSINNKEGTEIKVCRLLVEILSSCMCLIFFHLKSFKLQLNPSFTAHGMLLKNLHT